MRWREGCLPGNRMRVLVRFPASLLLAICVSSSAWAYDDLLGDYEGKIRNLAGHSGQVADACKVTLARSPLYGGSVSFEIHGADKLMVEERRVAAEYRPGRPEIEWVTPGGSPDKPGEVVSATFRKDGSLKSIRLLRKYAASQQVKFILCGELRRLP